jgi:hypothetical protein
VLAADAGTALNLAASNAVIAVTANELREKSTTVIDDVFG